MYYILLIFCLIESSSNYQLSLDPRTVNLELETALLIEPKDILQNKVLINNLHEMFTHFKRVLAPKHSNYRKSAKKTHLLTKFIKKMGRILLKYKDKHLRDVVIVLNGEIENYYERGAKLNSPLHRPEFKEYLRNKITEWKVAKPKILKKQIQSCYSGNHTTLSEFFYYLNQYFNLEDLKKLKEILKKIESYPSHANELKLTETVMDALDFIVFDRSENLDEPSKQTLSNEIRKLIDNLKNHVKDVDVFVDLSNAIENKFQSALKTVNIRSEDLSTIKYITGTMSSRDATTKRNLFNSKLRENGNTFESASNVAHPKIHSLETTAVAHHVVFY